MFGTISDVHENCYSLRPQVIFGLNKMFGIKAKNNVIQPISKYFKDVVNHSLNLKNKNFDCSWATRRSFGDKELKKGTKRSFGEKIEYNSYRHSKSTRLSTLKSMT